MRENRTVWKSDNQGAKEEPFIHTGRRGGDGQQGGENSRQGGRWRTGQARLRLTGEEVAGANEVVDCGLGSPTFSCR